MAIKTLIIFCVLLPGSIFGTICAENSHRPAGGEGGGGVMVVCVSVDFRAPQP